MKDVIGDSNSAGYDEANALVLPSQKRATKIKVEKRQNVKILSKKQRKHLQQIVDKKKKKEGVRPFSFNVRWHLLTHSIILACTIAGGLGCCANSRNRVKAIHID